MQIACKTISAAVDVLLLLLGAGLRPGGTFRVNDPYPYKTPVKFHIAAALPDNLVEQLQSIPDTTIVAKDAA